MFESLLTPNAGLKLDEINFLKVLQDKYFETVISKLHLGNAFTI